MSTIVVRAAARPLVALLLLFSLFLLLRGHNEPGGGFVGGLVAGSAFGLYAMMYGEHAARAALGIDSRVIIGVGLLVAIGAGLIAMLLARPLLGGIWVDLAVPFGGTLTVGTPLLFDVGVYLVVAGVTTTLLFTLGES